MAEFGYDTGAITQGKALLEATNQTFQLNKQEDVETFATRVHFDAKVKGLAKAYNLHRKKAKVIFRNDPVTLQKLALTGSTPSVYVKWIEAIKTFYLGIQDNPDIQAKLLRLRLTADDVTASLIALLETEVARAKYLREKGESQEATQAKDAAFKQIDDWMSEFFAVAKIAMDDKPQLLESLGILIRN